MAVWYRTGTAAVTNGSTAVVGTTTGWLNQIVAGDGITFNGGATWYEVAAVADNTHLTLATAYQGATASGLSYASDRRSNKWTLSGDLAIKVADLVSALEAQMADFAGQSWTWTGQHTWTGGVLASSKPSKIKQTWNAGGVVFEGRVIEITDTASAAGSLAEVWRVNGSPIFALTKSGRLGLGSSPTQFVQLFSNEDSDAQIQLRAGVAGGAQRQLMLTWLDTGNTAVWSAGKGSDNTFRVVNAGVTRLRADQGGDGGALHVASSSTGGVVVNGVGEASTGSGGFSVWSGGASPSRWMTVASGRVSIGASAPSSNASLDLQATDKALLLNRMTTTQRDAVSGWVAGSLIYNSTTGEVEARGTSSWSKVMRAGAATAADISGVREALTANRTYYVRTDGSDSNSGTADTAGGAFLTIGKAVDTTLALDFGIYSVTINVRAGTYAEQIAVSTAPPGCGVGKLIIIGDTATPSSVVIQPGSGLDCVSVKGFASLDIRGFRLVAPSTKACLLASDGAILFRQIDFGAAPSGTHCFALGGAASITCAATGYTISGGAARHMYSARGGQVTIAGMAVTVSGSPAFSGAFAFAEDGGRIRANANVYTGGATGKRFDSRTNAVINVNGGADTYFPGDVAGTQATGGQYA